MSTTSKLHAIIEYRHDPITGEASMFLQCPVIEEMMIKIGFEVREHARTENDNPFESHRAYLVRNIGVDNLSVFNNRNNKRFAVWTQRVANMNLLIPSDRLNEHIVNISQIRLVGIKDGKVFRVKPISQDKVKALVTIYSEGIIHYYLKLKQNLVDQEKSAKILDTELKKA